MKKALTILIGFIHDFAAGCWAATVLAVYRLELMIESKPLLAQAIDGIQRELFFLGLVCIVVVFLGGAGRTFTYAYIGNVYGDEAERLRRRMLMVKHVFLIAVFGAGTYWQYMMIFR